MSDLTKHALESCAAVFEAMAKGEKVDGSVLMRAANDVAVCLNLYPEKPRLEHNPDFEMLHICGRDLPLHDHARKIMLQGYGIHRIESGAAFDRGYTQAEVKDFSDIGVDVRFSDGSDNPYRATTVGFCCTDFELLWFDAPKEQP